MMKCLICGKGSHTQLHHLSYEPQVLIEVCNACHFKYGNGKKGHHNIGGDGDFSFWLGKIVESLDRRAR